MRELSLHILDIVQNSISANSNLIEMLIQEDMEKDTIQISIIDNGVGMTPELMKCVTDPFTTTRTTRKIGLGIPLLKAAAEQCGGGLSIKSVEGEGTTVTACFKHSHIDRAPLGNISETVLSIVTCNPDIDFVYSHSIGKKKFDFDTRTIKNHISGIKINNTEVVLWLKEYLNEGISNLYGGV